MDIFNDNDNAIGHGRDESEKEHQKIFSEFKDKDKDSKEPKKGTSDNAMTSTVPHLASTSCGPHRRGYLLLTRDNMQLVICSESEMRSDRKVNLGQHVLQLEDFIEELPPKIQKIAETELRETPETKEKSLKELKALLIRERDENQLLSPLDNDVILTSYLRCSHFYPESAFKRMVNYYRFKQKYQTYCANLIPEIKNRSFENNLLTVLPHRDEHGRRILVIRGGKQWDPSKCTIQELVRGVMMVVKAATLEPVTQTAGAVVIIDVKDLGYSQMKQLISLHLAEMLVTWVQECFPFRLKAIHVVNINSLFGMVLNVFKKFLNDKFQKRVIVHNKPDTLDIDKSILPKDLGGTLENFPDNSGLLLHKLLCLYSDQYEMVSKFGYPKEDKREKKGWFY